jgi:aminoglycoside/choline kinase family phosphotransferase
MKYWKEAARWLARFHSDFAERRERNGEALGHPRERFSHLLRHDEHFYTFWLAQAERFLRNGHVRSSPETRRKFGRIAAAYDRVVARLMAMPRTLIHGEFYPSNIIVRSKERSRCICPVDWEVAAIAPGLIDLGALTSGKWTLEQQTAMVAAYRSALEPVDGSPPALPELLEGVHYCQLHLSMQWLGWAADWSPPAQHAQNWLSEACRLGERLGL